jgi:hypothetical protein
MTWLVPSDSAYRLTQPSHIQAVNTRLEFWISKTDIQVVTGSLTQELVMVFNIARRNMSHQTLHSDIREFALVLPLTRGTQPGKWGFHVKVPTQGCERSIEYSVRTKSFIQRTSPSARDKRLIKGLQADNQAVLQRISLYTTGSHTAYIRYRIWDVNGGLYCHIICGFGASCFVFVCC